MIDTPLPSFDDLCQLAKEHGITIDFFDIEGDALALDLDGGYYIALNPTLTEPHLKQALAHELGHCFTRGFYSIYTPFETRERIEASANHWAYKTLLPLEAVQELAEKEILFNWEIADAVGLTEDFVKQAMDYYMSLDLRNWR